MKQGYFWIFGITSVDVIYANLIILNFKTLNFTSDSGILLKTLEFYFRL